MSANTVPFMKATTRVPQAAPGTAGRYDADDLGHDGGDMMAAQVRRDARLQASLARGGNGGVRCKR